MRRIALRGFRPSSRGIKQVLGELEADVMNLVWQQANQTVVEVEERLRRKRSRAGRRQMPSADCVGQLPV